MRCIQGLRMMPKTWCTCTLHARYFILLHNKITNQFLQHTIVSIFVCSLLSWCQGHKTGAWHKTDTRIFVVLMTGRIMSHECL